jgi:hypothetical protein
MFSMTIEASCDVMFTIRRAGLHRPRRRLQHSQRPEEEAEHALDVLGRSLEHVARLASIHRSVLSLSRWADRVVVSG